MAKPPQKKTTDPVKSAKQVSRQKTDKKTAAKHDQAKPRKTFLHMLSIMIRPE